MRALVAAILMGLAACAGESDTMEFPPAVSLSEQSEVAACASEAPSWARRSGPATAQGESGWELYDESGTLDADDLPAALALFELHFGEMDFEGLQIVVVPELITPECVPFKGAFVRSSNVVLLHAGVAAPLWGHTSLAHELLHVQLHQQGRTDPHDIHAAPFDDNQVVALERAMLEVGL